MQNTMIGYGFALLTAITVLAGDYFIKVAADNSRFYSGSFLLGALLYALAAASWYGSMRFASLAQASVAFSMLSLVAVCAMAVIVFGETINRQEMLGIGLAMLSMLLMVRHA
ncbi:MAG: EamA family transporter [Granulosicoccus sp.]|nr:EamA family transporter [Granulosicoccus sp.]